MDRRRNRRWPRQLEVRFWKQGEEGQATRAISTNISRTGIFVRTQNVLPSGSRVRVDIGHAGRSVTVEGVVMRALKSPAHLQAVMPSGMGVRFLQPDELLAELLPGVDLRAALTPGVAVFGAVAVVVGVRVAHAIRDAEAVLVAVHAAGAIAAPLAGCCASCLAARAAAASASDAKPCAEAARRRASRFTDSVRLVVLTTMSSTILKVSCRTLRMSCETVTRC
jgi:hypothetical protein